MTVRHNEHHAFVLNIKITILPCLSATDSETEEEVECSYHAGGNIIAKKSSSSSIIHGNIIANKSSSSPIIHSIHTDSTQFLADHDFQRRNNQHETADKNKDITTIAIFVGEPAQLTSGGSMKTSIKKMNRKRKLPTQFEKSKVKLKH